MKTKGTHLYFIDPRDDSITKLACPKAVTGFSSSATSIDTTCLDSDGMESDPGMPTPGVISVPVDFDTAKPSHMKLEGLRKAGLRCKWALGFGDGVAAPTVDSSGDFELPDTRSWILFNAHVADIPLDFAVNANVASTFSLQQSGDREIIPKVSS